MTWGCGNFFSTPTDAWPLAGALPSKTVTHTSNQGNRVFFRDCLKKERGCVVFDQPQQSSNFWSAKELAKCCGWSSTQPRSGNLRQALMPRKSPHNGS